MGESNKRLAGVKMAGHESPRISGTAVDLAHAAKYEGRRLGSGRLQGECAAGVQYVFIAAGKPIGLTATWKQGKKVRGNNIRPGTAIASFRNGRYRNDHAAILFLETPSGLLVWDQFNTPPKAWGIRLLKFNGKASDYSNNGDLFYTIE